jgi:hypothetical protein
MTNTTPVSAEVRDEHKRVLQDIAGIRALCDQVEDDLVRGEDLTPERMCLMTLTLVDELRWAAKLLHGCSEVVVRLADAAAACSATTEALGARLVMLERGEQAGPLQ